MKLRGYNFIEITAVLLILFQLISLWCGSVSFVVLHCSVFANLLQVIAIFIYCLSRHNLKKRFAFFVFTIAYSILLFGKYFTKLGNNSVFGTIYVHGRTCGLSLENEAKALSYLFLSLFVCFLSYKSSFHIGFNPAVSVEENNGERLNIKMVRFYSLLFMYLGAIPAFLQVISKVAFVFMYGYFATYLVKDAFFQNPMLDMFDKFYFIGFLSYLASFPCKNKLKLPVFLFLIYSILTLLTGTRGGLVVNMFFLIWYYMKRDEITGEKVVFTKKRLVFLGVFSIFFTLFMLEWANIRMGAGVWHANLFVKLVSFVNGQGISGKLVALGLEQENIMLNYISRVRMIIYPVYNFLINNSLSRLFTGGILGQSLNTVIANPNYASVISYVANPAAYLNGFGLGTCYVAELATAFGVIGVIVFNYLLGRIFNKIDNISVTGWEKNFLLFNAFTVFIYIPRYAAFGIIPQSFFPLLYTAMMFLLCGLPKKQKGKH